MGAAHATRWFWSDWRGDEAVRRLTPAERGVWIDLLALAAVGNPTGYVVDANGDPVEIGEIARFTNCPDLDELRKLIDGIAAKGAASRDRAGRLFNRRMVRDAALSIKRSEAGKSGVSAKKKLGNPVLLEQTGRGKGKGKDPPSPNTQTEIGSDLFGAARASKTVRAVATRLPDDWQPAEADIAAAVRKGLPLDRVPAVAEKFKSYWLNRPGRDGLGLNWHLRWCTWVANELEWNGARNGKHQQGGQGGGRASEGLGFSGLALRRARAAGIQR